MRIDTHDWEPAVDMCVHCGHVVGHHVGDDCLADGCGGCHGYAAPDEVQREERSWARRAELEQLRARHRWLVRVMGTHDELDWRIRHRAVLAELDRRGLSWCGRCSEWTSTPDDPYHPTTKKTEEER